MAATASLCSTCKHKISALCVECGGHHSSGPTAMLCTACAYTAQCIKCGSHVMGGETARFCSVCAHKFAGKCFKCGGHAS